MSVGGGERFRGLSLFAQEHPIATTILGGQLAIGTIGVGLGIVFDNPILIGYGGLIIWEDAIVSALFLPELKNRHSFINGSSHS